jgi:hypothetical protein
VSRKLTAAPSPTRVSSRGVCPPHKVFQAAALLRLLVTRSLFAVTQSIVCASAHDQKGPTLRFLRRRPSRSVRIGTYPFSGLDSPTEFHLCATANPPTYRSMVFEFAPSEVCSPTAFFQPDGATYPQRESNPTGYVTPSGFLTLTTPCSPPGLPSLFHLGSAHGVHPSRLSSSHAAVRPI